MQFISNTVTVQHSHRDFPIQSESFATYTNNALIGIKDTFKISQNFNNFKMFTKLHPWKVESEKFPHYCGTVEDAVLLARVRCWLGGGG